MASENEVLDVLREGELEVLGLVPYSSNYTFLTKVTAGSVETLAIYKPARGERPLWDFPTGTLAQRETAAYLVSSAAGWHLVPPTIVRKDAPMGRGSLQLFVDHDPERHFFVLEEERLEDFKVFALFDAVINNADRKSGHVLEDRDGKLWGIDHGVTFHIAPHLRTVIWNFSGQRLGAGFRAQLDNLRRELCEGEAGEELVALLAEAEVAATVARIDELLDDDRFPIPQGDRDVPWPLV